METLLLGQTGALPSGKIQTGGFDINQGVYVFENQFKNSFTQFAAKPFIIPSVMDNNGYPNHAPSNFLSTAINAQTFVPSAWGTTPVVVSWAGTGGIAISTRGFSNFAVKGRGITNQNSGGLIQILGTNVRITFNFRSAPPAYPSTMTWGFPPGTYSGMSGLIFCRQANEAAVLANNNLFNPDFLTLQWALNAKIQRSMDWALTNNNTSTALAQRAPTTAVAYATDRFIPGNWAGSVGGTNTYTLSAPSGWGGLVDGTCVHFYVPAAQVNTLTGPSVTLNVGGTGAKQITTIAPDNLTAGYLVADDGTNTVIWTATYSALYGYWTVSLGGLMTAVPLELHISLANALNQHLWYTVPHRWQPTDAAGVAALVLSNLNSHLKFYCEFSNEIWNTIFKQTSFVGNIMVTLGARVGTVENFDNGYALLARQFLGALTSAWTGSASNLKRVMAVWTVNNDSGSARRRLDGADLAQISQGGVIPNGSALWTSIYGAPNYRTVGNRPIDYCDVIATAPYMSGAYLPPYNDSWAVDTKYSSRAASLSTGGPSGWTTGILGAADAYAAGGSKNIANALAFVDWDLRQGVFGGLPDGTFLTLKYFTDFPGRNVYWERVAASYDAYRTRVGQSPLVIEQYEGAMAPSGPTTATCTAIGIDKAYGGVGGKVDNLITAYKQSPLFGALVRDMYNQFMGTDSAAPNFGLMPHSVTFCWFHVTGPSVWSALTNDLYSGPSSLGPSFSGTPYKSWDMLVAINHS
jgi:hypothetical protein